MTRDRRKLIDEIYTRALELSADERERYVRERCGDAGVRGEVLELLAAATSDRLDLQFGSIRERLLGEVITENPVEEDPLPGEPVYIIAYAPDAAKVYERADAIYPSTAGKLRNGNDAPVK